MHAPEDDSAAISAWGKLNAIANGKPRKAAGGTAESRDNLEKRPALATDGRRKRTTGRVLQLNTKVKPAFRAELQAMADARDIGLAEMLERILAEWKALGGKGAPTNA
jgi:hypothetical protein